MLIPDCGHIPPIEQPELFVTALNQFLTGIGKLFPTRELLILEDGDLSSILSPINLSSTIAIQQYLDGKKLS